MVVKHLDEILQTQKNIMEQVGPNKIIYQQQQKTMSALVYKPQLYLVVVHPQHYKLINMMGLLGQLLVMQIQRRITVLDVEHLLQELHMVVIQV